MRRAPARRVVAAGAAAGMVIGAATIAAAAAAAAPSAAFRLRDPRVTEASGIATAERTPGVVFVHNDSGDSARFFAIDERTGATVAAIRIRGARNADWEDLAAAPDAAGVPSVWLADIGDNDAVRDDVQIYRVAEPRLPSNPRDRTLTTRAAQVWRLHYPDGPSDAESFAVSPRGAGYVVTKSVFGRSVVYRIPARPSPRVRTMREVGTVQFVPAGGRNPFGAAGDLLATGAAISSDGRLFAVRTYTSAYVWRLRAGRVAAALRAAPVRIALPREQQGEGITFAGRRLLIDSEGRDSPVYAVGLPRVLTRTPASSTARSAATGTTSASASGASASASGRGSSDPARRVPAKSGRSAGAIVVGVVILLVLVATSVLFQLRRRRRLPPDD